MQGKQPAPLKATMQAKRLVILPDAEQIDSPLMAERIAHRGKPATGFEQPRHWAQSLFRVIGGQAFLIWTRRKGQELAEMIAARPPCLTWAVAA